MKPLKSGKVATFIIAGLVCLLLCFGSTMSAEDVRYEINPESLIGPYPSETTRVINAYERLMDRYMSLVESNMTNTALESKGNAEKLSSIEKKIDQIGERLSKIEAALNAGNKQPAK